jgi:hypothetical protein
VSTSLNTWHPHYANLRGDINSLVRLGAAATRDFLGDPDALTYKLSDRTRHAHPLDLVLRIRFLSPLMLRFAPSDQCAPTLLLDQVYPYNPVFGPPPAILMRLCRHSREEIPGMVEALQAWQS